MLEVPIHIAFCVDEAYVQYICVTIKSIAENNRARPVVIHLVIDHIASKSIMRLHEVTDEYKHLSLQIHVIDDTPLRNLELRRWPIHAWYRILLPDLLSIEIERVLYLDADTIVMTDLGELFDLDMTGKSIAAVVEDNTFNQQYYERLGYDNDKNYICSGVILMNLRYWREYHLKEEIIEWAIANTDKLKLPDQDTINYVCRDTKILLPLRFGIVQWFFHVDEFYEPPYLQELEDCLRNPAIIHYGFSSPWELDAPKHLMRDKWVCYNKMLLHPIRCIYKSKGCLLVKSILWDLLHLFKGRCPLTIEDAYVKIAEKKQPS